MSGETVKVPTGGTHKRIEVPGGGVLVVRRANKMAKERIASAVNFADPQDAAAQMRFTSMIFRWSVVIAEGIKDPDTGEAVEGGLVKHATLGMVCNEEVWNATPDDVASAVIAYACNVELPESLRGKF